MKRSGQEVKKVAAEQRLIHKQEFGITVRNFLSHLNRIAGMVMDDLRRSGGLSWRQSLRAWRYGFRRINFRIYGLDRSGNPADYLSYYQALKQLPINDRFSEIIRNKLMFPLMMRHYGMPTPEIKGVIRDGLFYPLNPAAKLDPLKFLKESCPVGERLVIKPIWGWHGTGFISVTHTRNGYQIHGEDISMHALANIVGNLKYYIVTEFVTQGEHGTRLYPDTTNTIRLMTFWDTEKSEPFIARVVQRIGTSRSFPVDNFKASGKGGMSALVDRESGELGPAARVDVKGYVTWYTEHPESHAQIKGAVVPDWIKLRESILSYAHRFAFMPCIGWDVVPTHSGFTIIEGNSNPGMPVMQVHGPMLTDPRIERFYRYHSVIS